jgi:Kef-type K+ transport system membrane component KefB
VVSAGGLVVPLALGCGVGLLVPAILIPSTAARPAFALFLGVAMCVSAIPVIAKTLLEMRLMHRDIGQLILGSATVDDLVGWVLLSVATAIATASLTTGRVLMALGAVVVAIVAAMFVARPAVNATFRLLNRNRSASSDRSLANTAGAVTIILLCAAGTVALRLEAVLGALLAGILIGTCRHVDRAQFRPLQTIVMAVLAPLFFATVGLRVDLAALADPLLFGIAMVILVAAVAGKFIGAYLAARVIRLSHWEGLALGAGLNARGVIEVIVAYVGLRIGVLTTGMFTVIILVAVVTSLMAPPLLRYAARRIPVTDTEEHRQLAMQI